MHRKYVPAPTAEKYKTFLRELEQLAEGHVLFNCDLVEPDDVEVLWRVRGVSQFAYLYSEDFSGAAREELRKISRRLFVMTMNCIDDMGDEVRTPESQRVLDFARMRLSGVDITKLPDTLPTKATCEENLYKTFYQRCLSQWAAVPTAASSKAALLYWETQLCKSEKSKRIQAKGGDEKLARESFRRRFKRYVEK